MSSLRLCRVQARRASLASADLSARLQNCQINHTTSSPTSLLHNRSYSSGFGLPRQGTGDTQRYSDRGSRIPRSQSDSSQFGSRDVSFRRGSNPSGGYDVDFRGRIDHNKPLYNDPGDPNRSRPDDDFERGQYHKHDKFDVKPQKKKFKAGFFKSLFYDDPAETHEPPVEVLAAHLQSVVRPASSSYRDPKPDPLDVLDAAIPFLKTKRQSNLDPFLRDISVILSGHFSTTPPDVKELPAVQKAVSDVLSTCFIRAASQHSIRSFRSQNQAPGVQADDVSDAYASYLLNQTMAAIEDKGRLYTMLDTLEGALDRYQIIGSGYRITVSLIAAWVVLRQSLGITTPPKYQFVWPSSILVIQYLDKFMVNRGSSGEKYVQGIHQLYQLQQLPDLPSTPESLQEYLRDAVKSGKEAEILDKWMLYRDQINQTAPEVPPQGSIYDPSIRSAVLYWFLHAIKSPWFGNAKPINREGIETASEEILKMLPKPYPREVLHTLVAHRARVIGMAPEIETGKEIYSLDKSEAIESTKDVALRNLRGSWAVAQEVGTKRDVKLYMLYMEGLGRLGDLNALQQVWNDMVKDEECAKLYREEEGGVNATFPPTSALNQMISASILVPGDGPTVALELFHQAAQENSSIPIDVVTINIVLRHYARKGDVEGMQSLFELADKLAISPDIVTYTTLLQGFLRAKNLEASINTLDMMEASGLQPNERMCTMIIADLAKDGNAAGLKLAEAMMVEMRNRKFKLSVITWTALISGYFRGSWFTDGWEAVKRMETYGHKLNRVSYNVILKQAGEKLVEGDPEPITFRILQKMVKDGVMPNSDTFVVTLTPLIKIKAWFEADKVIKIMEQLRYAPEKGALRGLLKTIKFRRRLA